ncbi:hypothetical protein NNJEOMEG_03609 [Fundidesulfovibrio magnetotacticus]|uniref:Uncharacterized protein n=1 Tax=Fundidesulfovibrio magnetotacticus TaxID=2730080 RepID=A0A6V8LYT0_9BACT|nr:hypothetical protein [Fundidesulfovibrio magnetotacticus]GFK95741.1 hypothetical protein NNJEOMEG_03609 [Fundidesulfovibrio magnetotacticus]
MRIDPERLVKLGLFACLALTFHKGFMKLPEVYPALEPERFYRGQVNDGENVAIMKERHFDINYHTGKAIELRLEEMRERGEEPADDELVTRERAELALLKALTKDVRNADYVLLAEEKLARARLREAARWRLTWSGEPAPDPVSEASGEARVRSGSGGFYGGAVGVAPTLPPAPGTAPLETRFRDAARGGNAP